MHEKRRMKNSFFGNYLWLVGFMDLIFIWIKLYLWHFGLKPTESIKKQDSFSRRSKILETGDLCQIQLFRSGYLKSFHIKSRSEERQSTGSLVSAVVLWRVRYYKYYSDVASLWRGTLTFLKYFLFLITICIYENISYIWYNKISIPTSPASIHHFYLHLKF